jgi:hypothetical protein
MNKVPVDSFCMLYWKVCDNPHKDESLLVQGNALLVLVIGICLVNHVQGFNPSQKWIYKYLLDLGYV